MNEKIKNIRNLFKNVFDYKVRVKGNSFFIALMDDDAFMLTREVAVDYAHGEDWKAKIIKYRNDAEKMLKEHPERLESPKRVENKIAIIDRLLPVWGFYLK